MPIAKLGYERGLSLIELMVAIAIGLLISAGLMTLMASTSASRGELQKLNMQIENGRYAFEVLADDIRHAGYYGMYRPERTASATPLDACTTDVSALYDSLGLAVQGISDYGATATSTIRTNLYSCLPASAIKSGTDVLVIRRVSTESYAIDASGVSSPSLSTDFPYLQTGIVPDSADPTLTTLGAKMGVATSTTVSLSTFSAKQKDAGTGSSASNSATYTTPAPLRQFLVHIYFISPCSNAVLDCSSGDSIPSLKRLSLGAGPAFPDTVPEVIAAGIENMQLDYGVNTGSAVSGKTYYDGTPDTFVQCNATSSSTYEANCNWQDIVAVRVNLLARNNDPSASYTDTRTYVLGLKYPSSSPLGPLNDRYKRHVYSGLVRVNNVAMSRECSPTLVSPC